MSTEPHRDMTDRERELIQKLLAPEFPGRDELAQQLQTAQVRVVDEDGSLEFLVHSDLGADHVKYVVPSEGAYKDPDGTIVHVLLHVAGAKAREIEFFREDGTPVRSWPKVALLQVFAPR